MNDRMLRYDRLKHDVFTDTLFSKVDSRRLNRCAQVFTTSFGWSRVYPLRSKGDAHEALSTLFHQDGVPPAMIMDGAKEERLSTFGRKCRQANCYIRPTEPYSPWQNMAEGCVREVKRALMRDMLWTGSPKRLWDHSLKLCTLIRSHTALDIYNLRGQR